MTVTQLARICGVSRGTVLYYESAGLLRAAGRTQSHYRRYTEAEAARLRQIRTYREAGLKLADIRALLHDGAGNAAGVLERRLAEIGNEIARLRDHQRSIVTLLQNQTQFERMDEMMTKDKWVAIMRASGFGDAEMHRWHAEFEKAAPEDHAEFLASLRIPQDEIAKIREWSRLQKA